MFIVVNSITIKIHSKAFHASFELWQLQGYSVNPNWQQSDLRLTRITDPQRGEVKSSYVACHNVHRRVAFVLPQSSGVIRLLSEFSYSDGRELW